MRKFFTSENTGPAESLVTWFDAPSQWFGGDGGGGGRARRSRRCVFAVAVPVSADHRDRTCLPAICHGRFHCGNGVPKYARWP